MKRWISFLSHLVILTVLTSFSTGGFRSKPIPVPEGFKVDYTVGAITTVPEQWKDTRTDFHSIFLTNDYIGFKEALAFKESQGRYQVVNTLGYLGKYQFGAGTLRLMGVRDTDHFLADAQLQERVFELNVSRNKWILRRDIKRFVGKKINGVKISEAGIVAAAHLAGAGNVKKYLRSYGKTNVADAYGSTIQYYMKKFSNYDISTIEAIHNPKV